MSEKSTTVSPGYLLLVVIALLCFAACNVILHDGNEERITITLSKKRAMPGDSVKVEVSVIPLHSSEKTEIFLMTPTRGTTELSLAKDSGTKGKITGEILLDRDCPSGFYVITAMQQNGGKSCAGKASFLVGKVVLDFAIMSSFSDSATAVDMETYLTRFISTGGNALTLHANMAAEKVWGGTTEMKAVWASKVCKNAADAPDDRIEMMLDLTDKAGLPSFLSVSWDLTDSTLTNKDYINSIRDITCELWDMFGHHPSLIGFYSYQEGSGTYFTEYMRDFCSIVKKNNKGLLTMCAPNIDDPLLAGYLAAIDDLVILNYQAPIMTSYRPDNRKLFPNRRARDVTSLSAGATSVNNKITLSHIEFMGYLENNVAGAYLTDYRNIFNQFASVASAFGPDGITFFTYYTSIYFNSKKLPAETASAASAVIDGLQAYYLISNEIAGQSSHLALYVPYNDWCIERWTSCFLPAADAMRNLGISTEIIPFIPGEGEDILPYYPLRINKAQLQYLLDNKYVLILPDISGMQETDSELIETFVRMGGVVIAFGPRIPYGDRFNREALWGAEEISPIQNNSMFSKIKTIKSPGERTKTGATTGFSPLISTSWNPSPDKRIADFADGSCAVFFNNYHKGRTYTISLSMKDASVIIPDLVRDILDDALDTYGISRPFDIYGIHDNMDVAMSGKEGKYSVMAANYNNVPVELRIKPLF
ncbi:MAG: DUF4434 domain-containing protein, partial [Bacteroidales bacterium]|nr:DUF4434 domain-containing protein [Bacteroidales bacterium]